MARRISRRTFGQLAVGAAAGSLIAPRPARAKPMPLAFGQFSHIVVVMFENRSFDNFLGYLYTQTDPPPRGQSFEGVDGRGLSNPLPSFVSSDRVAVHQAGSTTTPHHDPGEEYQHVNTQQYGEIIPAENFGKAAEHMVAPYNLPDPLPDPARQMQGFLNDYYSNLRQILGRSPTYAEYIEIMACFTPSQLRTFHRLAREFAVCDQWYCSVPSQTWTNRSFFHAAQSSGRVVNEPYHDWVFHNDGETIFNRLEDAKLPWKVYVDPWDVLSLTRLIHHPKIGAWHLNSHFEYLSHFYHDAKNGTLPAYSFIEPSMLVRHNDAHPPSDVAPADRFLAEIYGAIRGSTRQDGSNYQNTLLIVTFDEHGGTYDHVPPPGGGTGMATPPIAGSPAGQFGFRFDRLGVRVPTILISPHIEAGTVISQPLTHTALIRTICTQWGLASLTQRDANSPDLGFVFNRSTPRDLASYPDAALPAAPPPSADLTNRPLNALQQDISGAVQVLAPSVRPIQTVDQLLAHIRANAEALGVAGRSQLLPFVGRESGPGGSGW